MPANNSPPPPDDATIIAIYRDTVAPLYRFASQRCDGERAVAEDVTQETWLRAVRVWRASGVPDHPLSWLITVARNLLLNQQRRRPMVALDEVEHDNVHIDGEERASDLEIATQAMQFALTRMPPDEARLLEQFHFERTRTAQLAQELGVTERAVEGRLRRARARLRLEMNKAEHSAQEEPYEQNR